MSNLEKSLEDDDFSLQLRPRPSQEISLAIPIETVRSLEIVAARKQMSLQGILKFYIGQSLRQDLSQLYAEKVLETTQQVLSEHLGSSEAAAQITQEIRQRNAIG